MALELFRPYPVGISDLRMISILFFSRSFFGTDSSTTRLISLELMFWLSTSMRTPLPSDVLTSASTLDEIPSVAPFPVAIALTIDIAP